VDAYSNLATYIGIVSAGIVISLSDLLKNIDGWAFILIRRPFKIGDRIEVTGSSGTWSTFVFSGLRCSKSAGKWLRLTNRLVDWFTSQTESFHPADRQLHRRF